MNTSTLALLRQEMVTLLTQGNVRALSAWPGTERVVRTSSLVLVQVLSMETAPVGLQGYLGERYDTTLQKWKEEYGQRVTVSFALDLYSPESTGESGCRTLLDSVAGVLQGDSPSGLRTESWSAGEMSFDRGSGMFLLRMKVKCKALLMEEIQEDGLFTEVRVKGGIESCQT